VLLKDLATGEEFEGDPTVRTEWAPTKPLLRGRQYAWMVEATVDGEQFRAPAMDKPYATFRILDAQQAEELELIRKTWGRSHLVMGLSCAKAGLVDEAELHFRELVSANPGSSTAQRLLASVQRKPVGGGRK
jgi:hypothetical protein